jgi:deoxyribonuclease V
MTEKEAEIFNGGLNDIMNLNPSMIKTPKSVAEARAVQRELKKKVKIRPLKKAPRLVAGLDAAFSGKNIMGAVCLFSYPELELLDEVFVSMRCRFPYIPGLLTFREGPVLIKALSKLSRTPDVLLFDGQGIAHPEGMGIAAHIGALLDVPSIGCAKSRLVGTHREPAQKRGSRARLIYEGNAVGAALRTRDGVRHIYVSPGHRIDIEGAIGIVLGCATRYRLPEPIRCADRLSRSFGPKTR